MVPEFSATRMYCPSDEKSTDLIELEPVKVFFQHHECMVGTRVVRIEMVRNIYVFNMKILYSIIGVEPFEFSKKHFIIYSYHIQTYF